MKILYVEDDPGNRRAMQLVLRQLSHELILATSAAEGLVLAHQKPDIVLVDIGLPGTDGFVLLRQIREEKLTMPIIALTAHAFAGFREHCLNVGCADYVIKPFNLRSIAEMLGRFDG